MNREQNISRESAVISAATAFSGKGDVGGVIFEDIASNMSNNGHIFSGMIFPDTAVILMKGPIQTPMEEVLNAPMFTYRICERRYIR